MAVDRFRSKSLESDLIPPSVMMRAIASVDCNWSRTKPAVQADIRAARAEAITSPETETSKFFSLASFRGLLFAIGFLGYLGDLGLTTGFDVLLIA